MKRIVLVFCLISLLASCSDSPEPLGTEAPKSPPPVETASSEPTYEFELIDSLTAGIGSDMQEYRFELREKPITVEDWRRAYEICVFDRFEALIQTVSLNDFYPAEEEVRLIDFNFDGFLDILKPGRNGERPTYGYTWNNEAGKFVEREQLPDGILVSGARKQIHEICSIGGSKRIYEFVDDELTLVAELEIQMFESRMSARTLGDEPRTIVEYDYIDGLRLERRRYNFSMPLSDAELRSYLIETYYTEESYWNLENIGLDDFDPALVLRAKKEELLSLEQLFEKYHSYEGVGVFFNTALIFEAAEVMREVISFATLYSHSIDFYDYWPHFLPSKNSMFAIEGAVPDSLSYDEFVAIIGKTRDVSIMDEIFENPVNFTQEQYEYLNDDTFFVKSADIDNCGVDEITLFTVQDRGGSGLGMHNSVVFKKAADGMYDIVFALDSRYVPYYHEGQCYYIEITRGVLGFDILHIDASWNIERAVITGGLLDNSRPVVYCYLNAELLPNNR